MNRLSVLLPKSVPVFLAILSIWKTIRLLLSRILAKEILLQDQELPLFSRSVSKEEFSRLPERNERNSRLQAPATPSIETSEKTKESTAPEQVQPQPIPQKTAVEIPINGEWTKFQTVADAEQAAYEEYKANIARNAQNYKALPDEQREPGGPKARFQDNISALRLLQHLETTRHASHPGTAAASRTICGLGWPGRRL